MLLSDSVNHGIDNAATTLLHHLHYVVNEKKCGSTTSQNRLDTTRRTRSGGHNSGLSLASRRSVLAKTHMLISHYSAVMNQLALTNNLLTGKLRPQ